MKNADVVPPMLGETPDFSLVLGGPLYQLWRRAHLADDALRMLMRRILAMALVAWLPLALLSLVQGDFRGDNVELTFLHDVEFLWRVSRLDLNIMPTHPDRCGGLGFLAGITQGFAPVLVAQGALLAGLMASRMFFAGAVLTDFKLEVFGLVAVMVFAVHGPLLVFAPRLAAAKRTGLREYGALAHHYASAFDRKWLRGRAPENEALVGSADIQSLADMSHSYNIIKEMRPVLFNLKTVSQLALTTLIPATPLLLTIMPLEQLLDSVVKMLF
jgi:hypothetical protein